MKTHTDITDEVIVLWSNLLDTISEVLQVPLAVILQAHASEVEVLSRSGSDPEWYQVGTRMPRRPDLYCDTVLETAEMLAVTDGSSDPRWKSSAIVAAGFIAYLGFPISNPDGSLFGTLCVLDTKERAFSPTHQRLLSQFATSVAKDIAAFDRERHLDEARALYKLLLENAGDALFLHNADGIISYVNPKAEEMFGYGQEELIGETSLRLIADEYLPGRTNRIRTVMEKRELIYRIVLVHKSGERIPVEISSSRIGPSENAGIFSIVRRLEGRLLPEEELYEAERNLREAQRIGKLGNWTWDYSKNAVDIADEIYRIFGYQPDAPIELRTLFKEHIHPDDRMRVEQEMISKFERQISFRSDFRIIAADGQERVINVRGEPILSQSGEPLRFVGYVADISEQKARERELEESNARFKDLVEELGDNTLVYRRKPDGTIIYVSPNVKLVVGYTVEEVLGRKMQELFESSRDGSEFLANTGQMLSRGERVTGEMASYLHKDGTVHYISVNAHNVLDDSGKIQYIDGLVRDVTQEFRRQRELEESHDRFRGMVEDLGDNYMVYRRHLDGTLVYVSPGIEAVYGIPASEATGKSLHTLVQWSAESVAAIRKVRSQLESGIPVTDHDLTFISSDGERRDIRVSAHAVCDEHGQVVFIDGITRNITKEKKRQRELEESHERFRDLIEDLGDNYMVYRRLPDGTLTYISPSCETLMGITVEESIGRNVRDVIEWTEPYKNIIESNDKQLAEGHNVTEQEGSFRHKNGSIRHISINVHNVYDDNGAVKFMDGIVRDITEDKRRERELNESLNRFKGMVEDLGDTYVVYRHTPDLSMVYASPGCKMVFGIDPKDVIGKNYLELVDWTDDTRARQAEDHKYLIEHGRIQTNEHSFRHPDGSIRYITVSGHIVLDETGNPAYFDGLVVDITARKHIELALQESEERFNLAMSATAEGIWDVDIVNQTVYFTPRYKEMLGYNDREYPNELESWTKTMHPDDLDRVLAEVASYEASDTLRFQVEFRQQHKKGHWLNILARGLIVRDENGKAIRRIGTHQDITAQRQLEAQLRLRDEQLSEAQRVAHIGSWSVDLRTGTHLWSDESLRMFGYEPGEIEPSFEMYLNAIHPDDRHIVANALDYSTGLVDEMEYRIIRKDGAIRYLRSLAEFVYDEKGNLIRLFGSMQDITDKKQFELALRASEERFNLAMSATNEGIWDVDLVQNTAYYSPRWKEMLGYQKDELPDVNETWLGLIHPDDRQQAIDTVNELQSCGADRINMEFRMRHRSGEWRDILARGIIIRDEHGNAIRRIGTHQDVTEQRELEHRLRQSEERLREAQRVAQIGSWAINLPDFKLEFSEECLRLFGYELGEIDPDFNDYLNHVHPDDREYVLYVQNPANGTPESIEYRIVRKDGEVRYIRSIRKFVFDDNGQLLRLYGTMQDVTKQKMLQDALEASRERFNLAITASSDGIWDVDVRSNDIYYSPRWKEMLGYADHELENTFATWQQVMHPDDLDRIFSEYDTYLNSDCERFTMQFRFRHKNGSYRTIHSRAYIVRDENGNAIRATGTHTDITEKLELEDRLMIFQKLAEASGQGFGIATMDLKIIYANQRLTNLLELGSMDEIIGRNFTEFYPSVEPEKLSDEIFPALHENGQWTGELALTGVSGAIHHTLENIFIIRDEKGNPQYIADVVTPIDEIKRNEEQLKIFRQFAEESGQGFAMGTLEGKAVYANRTLLDMLELDESFEYNEDYASQVRIDGVEHSVKDFILPVLLKEGQWTGETTQVTENGRTIHTLENFFLISDDDGNPMYIGDVITPIDEIKEKEAQLEEARRAAEAASEAKSQFLANMSHEIRTPLNAIVGMSHLALNTDVTPKQRHYLTSIDHAGRTLRDIISSVLDFSKIEAGKLDIIEESFALEPILQQTVEMHVIEAAEKQIEIHADLDLDLPTHVVGDGVRLAQVLNNLLHNAVKFTEKGEVRLDVKLLGITDSEARIEFVVRDTGIGISESQMDRLFEVFSQADGSITRKYGGNGLGLAISKRLVELMGGTISVQSTVQEGTTFTVNVPFTVTDGGNASPDVSSRGSNFTVQLPFGRDKKHKDTTLHSLIPRHLRGKRVLLVDDSEHARAAATLMLGQAGIEVTALTSAQDALNFLNEEAGNITEYDALIIDLQLADINGLEFAKRIASRGTTLPPMLLATTVYWRNQVLAGALDAGYSGLIMKPMFPFAMGKALAELLSPDHSTTTGGIDFDEKSIQGKVTGHVLLVEDNRINQEVVGEILNNMGLDVTLAQDGSEAVTYIRGGEFDLVLMDVQMPKMDGLTATRYIRQMDIDEAKTIPIIAMTAHALDGDREKCITAGMNDYISKPIDPEYLTSILAKWITDIRKSPGQHERPLTLGEDAVWIKKLEDHGIGAVNALRQLGGKTDFYTRMLRHFSDEYVYVPGKIAAYLEQGQFDEARNEAHSLKNVAGYIGARSMWDSLVELNAALKEQSPTVQVALDNFTNEMTALVAVINTVLRMLDSGSN